MLSLLLNQHQDHVKTNLHCLLVDASESQENVANGATAV